LRPKLQAAPHGGPTPIDIRNNAMTQLQLDRAVASATGDCLSTIRHLGFSPLAPMAPDPEREPLVVDWDDLERQRSSLSLLPRQHQAAMFI
jgi:hypothetical protein